MDKTNKSLLNEYYQKYNLKAPEYQTESKGPDHLKEFRVTLDINNKEIFSSWFQHKKKAEEDCAAKALQFLNNNNNPVPSIKQQSPPKQQTKQITPQTKIVNNNNNNNNGSDNDEKLDENEELTKLKKQMLELQSRIHLIEKVGKNKKTAVIKQCGQDDEVPEMLINEPRDYQIEIYRKAMKSNIICCLPTGLGKTLIACMVIKKMRQLNPTKRIIFMVDRIPLVIQQANVIKNETGLTVLQVYGDSFRESQLSQEFDVLVIIGALLISLISSGSINLNNYCLVVIDESHHIVKDHPFSILLRNHLLDTNTSGVSIENQPKLLGLTASPTGKKDFLSTLLSLKQISKISSCEIIKPNLTTIQQYINSKNNTIVSIPTNNLESFSRKLYQRLMETFKPDINSNQSCFETCSEFIDFENDTSSNNGSGSNGGVININVLKFIQSYFQKINEYTTFNQIDGKSVLGLNLKQFIEREMESIKDGEIKRDVSQFIESIPCDEVIEKNHSKLEYALGILQQKQNELQGIIKTIIFVKTKKTAFALLDILEKISTTAQFSFIKPRLVIGHGSKDDGMSISKQNEAIQEFRQDKCNLIIATSVIEEGFDVPECNLVIRLDPPSTVTANIQSRGRLRKEDSYFFGIVKVDDPNENTIYEKFEKQEELLNLSIEFLLQDPSSNLLKKSGSSSPQPSQLIPVPVLPSNFTYSQLVEEIIVRTRSIGFEISISCTCERVSGEDHAPSYCAVIRITSSCGIDKQYEGEGSNKKLAKENASSLIIRSNSLYNIIRDLK